MVNRATKHLRACSERYQAVAFDRPQGSEADPYQWIIHINDISNSIRFSEFCWFFEDFQVLGDVYVIHAPKWLVPV